MVYQAKLVVCGPDGRVVEYELTGAQCTVGRAVPDHVPDVVLEPDPQGWISRLHCVLDFADGRWWVTDHARNGTFVERDSDRGRQEPLRGRELLQDRDTLVILADLAEDDGRLYWRLTYVDADRTRPAPGWPAPAAETGGEGGEGRPSVRYDWVSSRAYLVDGGVEVAVEGLRPKGHQLLRFMVRRCMDQASAEVACGHAELIAELWGDQGASSAGSSYSSSDLAGVVYALRKCIEPDPANPVVLETVPTIGYRLRISE
jgi:hypothetical protein